MRVAALKLTRTMPDVRCVRIKHVKEAERKRMKDDKRLEAMLYALDRIFADSQTWANKSKELTVDEAHREFFGKKGLDDDEKN